MRDKTAQEFRLVSADGKEATRWRRVSGFGVGRAVAAAPAKLGPNSISSCGNLRMPEILKPWSREKLDLHVTQRIRERADVALVIYRDDDDGLSAMLRDGAEESLWEVIQEAIADAGWRVCKK